MNGDRIVKLVAANDDPQGEDRAEVMAGVDYAQTLIDQHAPPVAELFNELCAFGRYRAATSLLTTYLAHFVGLSGSMLGKDNMVECLRKMILSLESVAPATDGKGETRQ